MTQAHKDKSIIMFLTIVILIISTAQSCSTLSKYYAEHSNNDTMVLKSSMIVLPQSTESEKTE